MQSFTQNMELWILAGLGVAGVLSALHYQVFGWRRNSRSMDLSLLAILLLAVSGSFVLPYYLPYPPFTWLRWVAENVPSDCSAACWERDLVFVSAAIATGLGIFGSMVVVLWGPWWLSPWSRLYRESSKMEEAARQAENQLIPGDAVPRGRFLYLSKPRRRASHTLAALEKVLRDGNADDSLPEYSAENPYIDKTSSNRDTDARI
jgi:hypothetical protein